MILTTVVLTTVVHCRKDGYDVYIGRPSIKHPEAPYGNPFIIGRDGTREEVIEKHKVWFYSQPELMAKVKKELSGKKLGCFCFPKSCHGDTYVEYCNGV